MRKTKAEAQQTRESVLKAASHVITRHGAAAFTLDAVAHEAGVTKGGVLHHFPSKEALINGLIDTVIERFQARLREELSAEPEHIAGRWLRAYIRTIFASHYDSGMLMPALAAVASADATTLERVRASFAYSQAAAANDGIPPTQATLIRLAVDGLVFARALNVDVLDDPLSQAVRAALITLTHVRPDR